MSWSSSSQGTRFPRPAAAMTAPSITGSTRKTSWGGGPARSGAARAGAVATIATSATNARIRARPIDPTSSSSRRHAPARRCRVTATPNRRARPRAVRRAARPPRRSRFGRASRSPNRSGARPAGPRAPPTGGLRGAGRGCPSRRRPARTGSGARQRSPHRGLRGRGRAPAPRREEVDHVDLELGEGAGPEHRDEPRARRAGRAGAAWR